MSPFVPGGVSDGQWHRVQLKYYNKVGVGRVPQGERSALGADALPGLGALPCWGLVVGRLAERGGREGWSLLPRRAFPSCWVVQTLPIPLGTDTSGH